MSRALVIRLSALGDVVHTIPAVAALRERYDISWVVESPYRELVEIVARVTAIPVRLKTLRTIPSALRSVRGFDVAIDFQGLIKSGVIARVSGARDAEETVLTLAGARKVAPAAGEAKTAGIRP